MRPVLYVMESTGNYHLPVAWLLNASGFYVSAVSAALAHDYGNNLRRAKTDKKAVSYTHLDVYKRQAKISPASTSR